MCVPTDDKLLRCSSCCQIMIPALQLAGKQTAAGPISSAFSRRKWRTDFNDFSWILKSGKAPKLLRLLSFQVLFFFFFLQFSFSPSSDKECTHSGHSRW